MCEYVSDKKRASRRGGLALYWDIPADVGGRRIQLEVHEDMYYECWHPETDGWEVMLAPPPGMSIEMSPGSKIRCRQGTPPEHTRNKVPELGAMRDG